LAPPNFGRPFQPCAVRYHALANCGHPSPRDPVVIGTYDSQSPRVDANLYRCSNSHGRSVHWWVCRCCPFKCSFPELDQFRRGSAYPEMAMRPLVTHDQKCSFSRESGVSEISSTRNRNILAHDPSTLVNRNLEAFHRFSVMRRYHYRLAISATDSHF
jgi:hypothetical protein